MDGKKVFHVSVEPSDTPCFCGEKQEFYIRTNPAADPLVGKELMAYIKQRFS